jgi:hypothetical protein
MKSKTVAIFLCLLLAVPFMNGCSKRNETGNAVSDSQSDDDTSGTGIPDEAKQKLQAALDVEPITIPPEEWTVDTICQVTYFLGKNISIPCTLSDFGDGLELIENDTNCPISFDQDTHIASGFLTYYGTFIGGFVVKECNSIVDIFHAPIQMLNITFNETDSELVSPISCNGVGLGDSEKTIEHELAFMNITTQDETKGFYSLEKKFLDGGIFVTFSDNAVKAVRIRF